MNLQFRRSIFVITFFICLGTVAVIESADPAAPAASVNAFYTYHFSHDMGFTVEALKNRSEWLTPELLNECNKYFAIPEIPDEPPYIEGDPFTGSQEYPSQFSTGPATISETAARVPVTFTWKEDGHSTKATALLKQLEGTWLIDDVEFQDQESFRQLLRDASAQPRD